MLIQIGQQTVNPIRPFVIPGKGFHHCIDNIIDHAETVSFMSSPKRTFFSPVDDLSLLINNIIIFQTFFLMLKLRDSTLRVFRPFADHIVLNGHIIIHSQAIHYAQWLHRRTGASDRLPKRHKSGQTCRPAAGAAAQLVVNAPGFMALGSQYIQSAQLLTLLQHNIGAASRHIGGDTLPRLTGRYIPASFSWCWHLRPGAYPAC